MPFGGPPLFQLDHKDATIATVHDYSFRTWEGKRVAFAAYGATRRVRLRAGGSEALGDIRMA